jgi:outer membrane protein
MRCKMKPGSVGGRRGCGAFACGLARLALACSLLVVGAAATGAGGPPVAAQADSLAVTDAVRLALANHPALVQAEAGLAAAEARIEASRSPRYPDVLLSSVYTRIGPVPEFDIPGVGTEKLAPENSYDLRLGVRQTLYDFGKTQTSVELARAGRETAGDYVNQVKSSLAYRTISVFNAILIFRENVAVLDEQIATLNQHLEVSRKKVRAGTATDFDVLTTQVRIALAGNDRIDAANALESQEIAFRQLTGWRADQPLYLKGDFARRAVAFDSAAALAAAFEQRPEIVIARGGENSAALQVRFASLGDRPLLALNLSSGFKNGYQPNLDQIKANYAAGLQFQVPVFNGHRTRSQRIEAEANLRSARARTEDIKRQIAAEVEQAMARAQASWEKTGNAEILVRQAEEAVSMAKTRYEAGVVTNLDLLDSETTLTQAKLGYLRALYAYSVSLVDFDRATGKQVW